MIRSTTLAFAVFATSAGAALADGHANANNGESVFRQCASCHSLEEGRRGAGPSLFGVYGSEAGQAEGFNYSPAIADSGIIWNDETLAGFLADPRGYLPGNRMGFRGISDEQDLADLIAFLQRETE